MSLKMISSPRTSSQMSQPGEVHEALQDIDPATKFLYTPHTLTGLTVLVGTLIYFSGALHAEHSGSVESNMRCGLLAAIGVFLCYEVLQGPTTSMIRPHPAVWRIIHGVVLIYLLVLVFFLFLNADQARQALRLLYPELGVELPERSYGSDCRLYIPGRGVNWETIRATLFDEFVFAHLLGWWGKAIIIRDRKLLWILSIGFELTELTFSHMLPNFNECWWDSWVLDVLVCNWLGLWLGMKTVKWIGSLEYQWDGISRQPTVIAKAKRSIAQFWPYSWDRFEWNIVSSPKRLLQSLGLVTVILLVELNAFFLKYLLWVPPLNPLNPGRLILWFLLGVPAVREYYMFIDAGESEEINKLGSFAWLAAAVALAESSVCIKFAHGEFPAPWPKLVLQVWAGAITIFSVFLTLWLLKWRKWGSSGSEKKRM